MTVPTSSDQPGQDSAPRNKSTAEDEKFDASWRNCAFLTPRQACAIASTLNIWADGEISLWLDAPNDEALHTVRPFEYFDRRVMVHVGENRAWAEKMSERCYAIAIEIESGILPFDRAGAYIDEVLMSAAIKEAMAYLSEVPDAFDSVPPRLAYESDDGVYSVGDDDWGQVSDHFDDICRFDEWEVPLYLDHPLLPAVLADRHPFTWFDVVPATGPGYLQRLKELAVGAEEGVGATNQPA